MANDIQDAGSLIRGKWNETIALYTGAYMFEFFLYGLYALLFSFLFYIVVLYRRFDKLPFVAAATAMFIIATADVIIAIAHLFQDKLVGKLSADPRAKYAFFVTNNAIADLVIFYRFHLNICFGWKLRWIVLSLTYTILTLSTGNAIINLFGVSLLIFLACGYFYAQSPTAKSDRLYTAYLWATFALNATLSFTIVSRNIYLVRTARSVLGSDLVRRYPAFISTLVDSGIVYSLYLLVDLTAQSLVLDAGLNQVVGIVPTLLIIRLSIPGRGRQDSVDSFDSSDTPVLDSIPSIGEFEAELPLETSQGAVSIQMDARTDGRTEHA